MLEIVEIGFFSRTHGFKGDLILSVIPGVQIEWDRVEAVLYGYDAQGAIPGFIEQVSVSGNKIFLKLEGIKGKELAAPMIGKKVYCDKNFVHVNNHAVAVGYQVQEVKYGYIGEVIEIQQLPGQEVFVVLHPTGKEILLPYISVFVNSINAEEKKIIYEAPEGLIEIYLG